MQCLLTKKRKKENRDPSVARSYNFSKEVKITDFLIMRHLVFYKYQTSQTKWRVRLNTNVRDKINKQQKEVESHK